MSKINKSKLVDAMSTAQVLIIDNYLEEQEFLSLKKRTLEVMGDEVLQPTYYPINNSTHKYVEISNLLIGAARKFYDLKSCIGYEIWNHNNTRPSGRHSDKDDVYYALTGKLKYPICTVVYYLNVDMFLEGGLLKLEQYGSIVPKENRVVMFGPGIFHEVEKYTGQRVSFVINPWSQPVCDGPDDVPSEELKELI